MQRTDSRKDPDAGKDWGQEEKGVTEDEMISWHHWLNGHAFEQTPGDSEGQKSLACCSSWGHQESDMTKWMNNNKSIYNFVTEPTGLFWNTMDADLSSYDAFYPRKVSCLFRKKVPIILLVSSQLLHSFSLKPTLDIFNCNCIAVFKNKFALLRNLSFSSYLWLGIPPDLCDLPSSFSFTFLMPGPFQQLSL